MRYAPTILSILLLAGCSGGPDGGTESAASDTTASRPESTQAPDDLAALESPYAETVLRNDYVDVHRVSLPAGADLAAHRGGPRVVYSLGEYSLRFETDGVSESASFESGDVHQHAAGVHSVENVGESEARFVVFERREAPVPTSQAEGDTPVRSPAEGASEEVLFESDLFQVHEVTLQPGAQLPPHRGRARAIYSLSDYQLEFTSDAGTEERTFEAGDTHVHDPGDHSVENTGDTVASFLVVEFFR